MSSEQMIIALHTAGELWVGHCNEDSRIVAATAINATRLHGSAGLLHHSRIDDVSIDEFLKELMAFLDAAATYPDEFDVRVESQKGAEVTRIDVVHRPNSNSNPKPEPEPRSLAEVVDAAEKQAIQAAVDRHGRDREAAANDLGISQATLGRKMVRLGVVGI